MTTTDGLTAQLFDTGRVGIGRSRLPDALVLGVALELEQAARRPSLGDRSAVT